jgi:hypothetical protein
VIRLTSLFQNLPGGQALNHAKDKLISDQIQAQINRRIKSYGAMLNLNIDTQKKTISLVVDLKGETAPLTVEIRDYAVATENGQTFVEIDGAKVQTSRDWLNTLLSEQVRQRRIPLPQNAAPFIKLLA